MRLISRVMEKNLQISKQTLGENEQLAKGLSMETKSMTAVRQESTKMAMTRVKTWRDKAR
jgi:hypothetical protein